MSLKPAGRKLDNEILMRTLGHIPAGARAMPFSTDDAMAVSLMTQYGLVAIPQSDKPGRYRWYVCKPRIIGYGDPMTITIRDDISVSADTLPHAVALCTLRLLGGSIWSDKP